MFEALKNEVENVRLFSHIFFEDGNEVAKYLSIVVKVSLSKGLGEIDRVHFK